MAMACRGCCGTAGFLSFAGLYTAINPSSATPQGVEELKKLVGCPTAGFLARGSSRPAPARHALRVPSGTSSGGFARRNSDLQ